MLDLIRLSPRAIFPPGGVALYREIAQLTGMGHGTEVLDVACGKGVALEYFAREYGVAGSGIEADPLLVVEGMDRIRAAGLADRVQIQTGRPGALPYRDGIFEVVIGEVGLTAWCEPVRAVGELVRVTRAGGSVVLVQLVWKTSVDEPRQQLVVSHFGARPLMMMEWKKLLRDAGVGEVRTENWADKDTSFRSEHVKPFPDFTEIFSIVEKVGILRRAWGRWGWTGIRALARRQREIGRLLTRDRAIGLDLIQGTRLPNGPARPAPSHNTDAARDD